MGDTLTAISFNDVRAQKQVDALLEGIAPLLAEAESGETPEINV